MDSASLVGKQSRRHDRSAVLARCIESVAEDRDVVLECAPIHARAEDPILSVEIDFIERVEPYFTDVA